MTKCDVSASSTNLIYNRTGIWTCSVFRRGKISEKSLILGAEKISHRLNLRMVSTPRGRKHRLYESSPHNTTLGSVKNDLTEAMCYHQNVFDSRNKVQCIYRGANIYSKHNYSKHIFYFLTIVAHVTFSSEYYIFEAPLYEY